MKEGGARHAVCLIAMLLVATAVQAQSRSATMSSTTSSTKTPVPHATPAPPADEAGAIFARWDTDHNGTLSLDEFRAGWHQLEAAAELHRLHEQFVAMDSNKNGCLNAPEYAHLELIQHAGTSAPSMSMFDTEKNQCLDFKEYVNVVNYMVKHEHK